jgi:hypothetical protein
MGLQRVHAWKNMSGETQFKFKTLQFDFTRQHVETAAQWLH